MYSLVVKTLITQERFTFSSNNHFQIINTIFSSCSYSGWGGAVYVAGSELNISFFYCTFDKCSTSDHGGGFSTRLSNFVVIHSTCFSNCFGRCPGYLIHSLWSDVIKHSKIELTAECNPHLTSAPSSAITMNSLVYKNNNVSQGNSNELGSSFGIGCSNNGVVAEYNNFGNSKGPTLFGFITKSSDTFNSLFNLNLINHSLSSSWFYEFSLRKIHFENCLFIEFSNIQISSSSSEYNFSKCYFDKFYSSIFFVNYNTNGCYFNVSFNLYSINILNTKNCWNFEIIDPQFTLLYMKLNYLFNSFILFFFVI